MRRTAFVGSLVVALLALGAIAQAISVRAQPEPMPTAGSGLVGSWRVMVTNPDGSQFPVLSSYMADGTTIHDGPISQPAAPRSPNAVVFQSAGHGVWEATGPETSSVSFEVLTGDEHGNFLGRVSVSGVQALDPGGDSFTGHYVITVTGPTGKVVAAIPTTAKGERMHVEIPPSIGAPAASPQA